MDRVLLFLGIVWDKVDYPAWIGSLAALIGVPLSMVSLIKLVRKDKEKEQQIAAIINITTQLADQVKELSAQTSEFKFQSDLMFEHNKIIEQQIELQKSIQIEHRDFEAEKLSIIKQERLMHIRPYFVYKGGGYSGGLHDIVLTNKGGAASEIKIDKGDMQSVEIRSVKPELDRGGLLSLKVEASSMYFSFNVGNSFKLDYKDIDGNCYVQSVGINPNATYNVSKPILINHQQHLHL